MPIHAFIIRPFGKKTVTVNGAETEIDFNRVEAELINPALERLKIAGRTTIDIMRAGNIREDMFHRLLTADLVIADLSIHNANVFYELGLRHAFRDKYTYLIRSESSSYPFDLQTDRYLAYNREDPGASLADLLKALKETLRSDAEDSPVYKLIPNLKVQERSRFLAAPLEFREAVKRAKRAEQPETLRLLAAEVEGFIWESEGLREVGRAQMDLNFFTGAKVTWEALQRRYPNDPEANMMLATVYQRLSERLSEPALLSDSEHALDRVRSQQELDRNQRSEVLTLDGKYYQSEWKRAWDKTENTDKKRERALSSSFLRKSFDSFLAAFHENLNNYHAGLSALIMLKVEEALANAYPAVWSDLYDSPNEEQTSRTSQIFKLTGAVELSLEAEKRSIERVDRGMKDSWLELNEAVFYFFTSKQARKIAKEFEEALTSSPPASYRAIKEILDICQTLGVATANIEVALDTINSVGKKETSITLPGEEKNRILIFAGHRISVPKTARLTIEKLTSPFPPGKENEARARKAIEDAVRQEAGRGDRILFGMAGGANGSEILFHEVCQDLGINTKLFLAAPPNEYINEFVSGVDQDDEWVERFNSLYHGKRPSERFVLSDTLELPRWLQAQPNYNPRTRSNLWLLQHALVNRVLQGAELTLIVLWDGEERDVIGRLDDLVRRAKEAGVKVVHLATGKIFKAD